MSGSEIPRGFVQWDPEDVVRWLSTLQLSTDYAKQFRGHNIDGAALLRLNPASLTSLCITDRLDRVKLLQQITTMQADLASLASPARRWRGSGKFRRFSENGPAYRTLAAPTRKMSIDEGKLGQTAVMSRPHARSSILDSYPEQWTRTRAKTVHSFPSSDNYETARSIAGTTPSILGMTHSIGGTTPSILGMAHSDVGTTHSESDTTNSVTRSTYSDVGPPRSRSAEGREEEGVGNGVPLRRRNSPLKEKKKRLSRSMDKLWEAHLASNLLPLVSTLPNSRATHGMSRYHNASTKFPDSLAHQESVAVRLHNGASHSRSGTVRLHDSVSRHDSGAARLVEILRDENASLKRELETYYQRVRKLMKLEQELEGVREAHRQLEESSVRKQRLEAAMRVRLEAELARFRGTATRHRADLGRRHRKSTTDMNDGSSARELKRRHSVSRTTLQQAAEVRGQLKGDSCSTLGRHDNTVDLSPAHDTGNGSETDAPRVYSRSIERLKEHLQSLQVISRRREGLESRVRNQLQAEIQQLRGREGAQGEGQGEKDGEKKEGEGGQRGDVGGGWAAEVAVLQADLARWEQKCAELTAEREMAVEVAVVPREARISQLERALGEREEEVSELTQQSSTCHCQLVEAHSHIAELQARLSTLQRSLAEKDSAIHPASHSSPNHQVHSSPPHQVNSSPPHLVHSSPPHQVNSSPPHQVHSSPPHQVHSSPPHQVHSSPPHQVHMSPIHQVYSSPRHQFNSSPSHQVHSSPSHQIYSSPSHNAHLSPTHSKKSATSGSILELSHGSSTSPNSSLISEPQSHSDTHRLRDQRHTPYLTNGGGDPALGVATSLPARAPPTSEGAGPVLNTSPPARLQDNEGAAPTVSSSLTPKRHVVNGSDSGMMLHYTAGSPLPSVRHSSGSLTSPRQKASDQNHSKISLPASFPASPRHTSDQSDCSSSGSTLFSTTVSDSPRHTARRVKSKTPPPYNEARILQARNHKYSSLDRAPSGNHTPSGDHTPSELQLFNTLLGDATLSNYGRGSGGRGVKPMGALFTHHHGNPTSHRV